PAWFVPSLEIGRVSTFVIVDDDATAYDAWRARIARDPYGDKLQLLYLNTPDTFESWIRTHPTLVAQSLFLMDYEFLGSKINGIELIRRSGIASHSIIVSGRFSEWHIHKACIESNLRLIPKSQIPVIPISAN